MNGWQALVNGLEAENIPIVFGLPGSPGQFYDALYDSDSIRSVLVRHEASGVFMAMAWARITNQPAVAFGSPGPGVANLVAGALEAYSGCTPMLLIGVGTPTDLDGMGAFQEADQVGMMKPVTKWAASIDRVDRTNWYLRRAISIATNGQPGPVYLEFPSDIGLQTADMPVYEPALRKIRPAPDPDRIAAAAERIERAERPLIICGGGSILSDAGDALRTLIDTYGIPVQTTPAGRGIIADTHILYCGMVGLYRTTFPREIYEESDLLITVGARMEEFQSAAFRYFPTGADLIQIDIEPSELGRNWQPDLAIQSDASLALNALSAELARRGFVADDGRSAVVMERRAAAIEHARDDARSDAMPMQGRRIVSEINQVFGANTILVKENGGADLWSYFWPYYQARDAGCIVPPAEQTVMGLGVAGSIGAKLARPDRQVVCTTGDGAFQMSMQELPTAAQEQAPVTWVVMNDRALGWPRWSQKHALGERYIATEFSETFDFAAVARASGCEGWKVEQPDELQTYLERARQANLDGKPAVVEVPVDQDDKHDEFRHYYQMD